jgi:hypothetical protein
MLRQRKEESSSFLKKRTKKLMGFGLALAQARYQNSKSFLLLFFKKEVLPLLPSLTMWR